MMPEASRSRFKFQCRMSHPLLSGSSAGIELSVLLFFRSLKDVTWNVCLLEIHAKRALAGSLTGISTFPFMGSFGG